MNENAAKGRGKEERKSALPISWKNCAGNSSYENAAKGRGKEEQMSLLSVIVPCYNEEENVACFYEELMKKRPFF